MGFPGGPDVDLYAYARNRPTMLTDPTGLSPSGCGFLGWSCVASFFAEHWQVILLGALDLAALGLTVYAFGLVVPVVSGVILPGVEAAWPWFAAGTGASFLGLYATLVTGGNRRDLGVGTTTNLVPVVARLPEVAVFADMVQLLWDIYHAFQPKE
jgi:hypothetical protein